MAAFVINNGRGCVLRVNSKERALHGESDITPMSQPIKVVNGARHHVDVEAWFVGHKSKRFLAKDVIYHEGDNVDMVYVICCGMVKLLSYLPNGRARIVRLHASDHWIGLEGLVGLPYEHTAIAIGDVDVLGIPMVNLRLLERNNPEKFSQLLRNGYGHLKQADMWISDFSTGGIKPRVARLVDFLSKLEYGDASSVVELLTVHEMAEILGVTPESVSRVLATFKRSDILHKQDNVAEGVYQLDLKKLHNEARQ